MNQSSSEDDSDINVSELMEYVDTYYEEIKKGKLKVKIVGGEFRCPVCTGKKKQVYVYKDLLQHASGVGNGSKKNMKWREKYLAVAKYLETDLATTQSAASESKPPVIFKGHDEVFVYPWTGIVVNIETKCEKGKAVGESGSRLRDGFIQRGFNPQRVTPLWDRNGFTGKAIVTFHKGLTGFHNAMSFEKAFVADHHGKSYWRARKHDSSGTYGWVARDDDYNNKDVIGAFLRRGYGDLKTTAEDEADEDRKTSILVTDLKSRGLEALKRPLKEKEEELEGVQDIFECGETQKRKR